MVLNSVSFAIFLHIIETCFALIACFTSNFKFMLFQMIQHDVFNQQAMMLREYMLAPSFVAIHWLINFKDTAIEDNRHMV